MESFLAETGDFYFFYYTDFFNVISKVIISPTDYTNDTDDCA